MTGTPLGRASALAAAAVVALAGVLGAGLPTAAAVTGPTPEAGSIVPGRYIVTLRPGADRAALLGLARGLGAKDERGFGRVLDGFAASLPPKAAAQLERDPRVARVEPDRVVAATGTQSPAPWGLDRVDQRALPLSGGYSYDADGAAVTVYVVDTGIASAHRDFSGRVATGYSAIGGGTEDCQGHGTHVAGTVGGSTYGVAKQVLLVPVRVLDCDGYGTTSGVIAGLDWIVADKPRGDTVVANLSLGGGPSAALDDAVRRASAGGVLTVVAAGNSGVDACTASPARVAEAVTVGATDSTDRRAGFSNYGSCLDTFAPGVSITSASSASTTGTVVMSGTSMAAPHVAGAAALLLGDDLTASPATIAQGLVDQATPGVVTSRGTGSPDRLLYTLRPAPADPSDPGDTTPPATVSDLAASPGYGRATLTWENPWAADLDRVVVRRATGATAPDSPTAGDPVASALTASATATGLAARTDHSFAVFAVDRAGNASPARTVTLRGTTGTLGRSTSTLTYGYRVRLTGRLTQATGGASLAGRSVGVLERRAGATAWRRVATLTTDSTGRVSTLQRPTRTAEYALHFGGAGSHLGTRSTPARVTVRQRVTSSLSTSSIRRGDAATLTGRVYPGHPGQAVSLQRKVSGTWRYVASTRLSSSSSYRFRLRPWSRTTHYYRVVRAADSDHARGISATRSLSVR